MHTKKILTLSIIFVLIACSQHQNNKTEKNLSKDSVASANNYPSLKTSNSDSSALPDLHAGDDTFIMKLHLDGIKDRKIIPIKIISGKELFATIKTNTKRANIRINQIEMPDSTFDGPFGDSLHYNIKMPGTYKIIIGEDLMAEGNWSGYFTLQAWTK